MKSIDIYFFNEIEATYPNESQRPILKWCNWYLNGIKRPYIEIELLLRTLFNPATDLITEEQVEAMDDQEALKFEAVYETVEINSDSIDRFYSLEYSKDANVYFISMETLISNVRRQIIIPEGYAYEEEFEGHNQYLIQRLD